jgi:hypothetical protein
MKETDSTNNGCIGWASNECIGCASRLIPLLLGTFVLYKTNQFLSPFGLNFLAERINIVHDYDCPKSL